MTNPSANEFPSRQGVVVLGSTGSIGTSTLDVIARHPDRFRVVALTAGSRVDRLYEQCQRFHPELVAVLDPAAAGRLERQLRSAGIATEVVSGVEGLRLAAAYPHAQIVMAAIVGAAGLLPTLAAVRAGKRVLLANKEPLVMCGRLLVREAHAAGALLLPIDSEHNAIFQCLPAGFRAGEIPPGIRRLFLTCSGGPFHSVPQETLARVTPEQACAHPRWVMGRKISVDSATLMNKGLEVIEACTLFGVAPGDVEVVVHPQSVIHSMVEYLDGSVLAQLANPDMRVPIAHALAWPERVESGAAAIRLFDIARLDFTAPDTARFPCLALAYDAAREGGTAPAVLNAANEVAVAAFLHGTIAFTDIPRTIESVRRSVSSGPAETLDAIRAADAEARSAAEAFVTGGGRRIKQGVL